MFVCFLALLTDAPVLAGSVFCLEVVHGMLIIEAVRFRTASQVGITQGRETIR